jgi:hypothetical protein
MPLKAPYKRLASGVAEILLSYAAHGMATRSLAGMGEITLRDGLVVAAAAAGAAEKRAWIIEREIVPNGWAEGSVDLIISRAGNAEKSVLLGGVELKWWRQEDGGNASNRRRDLVKDFIRAGSLYQQTQEFSFVALLSTAGSWTSTASTKGSDKELMQRLLAEGSQQWNIENDKTSAAVRNAVASLRDRVPVPNIVRSELLVNLSLRASGEEEAFARVWSVRKPQKTRILQDSEMDAIIAGGT